MGLVLFSMPWSWDIGTLISAGCSAEDTFTTTSCMAVGVLWEEGDLKDGNNTVDASNTSLLREFMCLLVKKGFTDGRFTAIEVLEYNSLFVETKVFSLGNSQTTLSFSLS